LLPAVADRKQRRLYGIYSAEQLRELIQYEKSRSNRKGTPLSLVAFDTSALGARETRAFVEGVCCVVRHTDHVGWIRADRVGVLLPFTEHTGAQVLIDHVAEWVAAWSVPATCYTYPDVWFENARAADPGACGDARRNTDRNPGQPENERQHMFVRRTPVWKRVLDLFGAGIGILILSPVFLLVALFTTLVSPGPVIYRQQRVGIGRTPFTFFKFRTMHVNSDDTGHASYTRALIAGGQAMNKLDDADPRIIFGGRVLRKTCIDELPQLFNVLRGDMSLVGPRPCIPYEAGEYLRWHTDRFSVLPGLTGLWQVSGKNRLSFQQMIRLDIEYEHRESLSLDLHIILKTIPVIAGMVLESVIRRLAATGESQSTVQPGSPAPERAGDPLQAEGRLSLDVPVRRLQEVEQWYG
jgi:lipopolysaccharide/colanic/teichoic acid biosynthesis glycosyltransferase